MAMGGSHHHRLFRLHDGDPFFPFPTSSASHPFDDAIIHHPFLFSSSCPFAGFTSYDHLDLFHPTPTTCHALDPFLLHSLTRRVSALELAAPRASRLKYTYESESAGRKIKCTTHHKPHGDRTLKWEAQIDTPNDDGFDRKCKWESKSSSAAGGGKTKLKYAKEVKGKGWLHPWSHAYSIEEVFGGDDDDDHHHTNTEKPADKKVNSKDYAVANKEEHKKNSYSSAGVHIVEIDDNTAGCVAIKKAFASTYGKGKRKELSPLDAAMLIQMSYRAHLAHRSQVLRCLRDLAVAKAKLKEIRSLFYNISYRRRIAHDTEERQRFAEKIIVLLLTVDTLEGPDYMVRNAKRSMLEELEGMLEIVDPQPPGKPRTLSRRKFDLPEGRAISSEMSGVKNVVKIVEEGK